MRPIVAALALAVSLAACDVGLPGDPVALATWTATSDNYDENGELIVGCVLIGIRGELTVDPTFGTALGQGDGIVNPVRWPPGFTAVQVGSEVAVLDRDRHVVAATGQTYEVFYTQVGFVGGPGAVLDACGDVR